MPKEEDITTWRIGTPDLVVRYPDFKMPAAGPDLYGALTTSFGLQEDRYIKAIQSRVVDAPSRKVVHHALSYAVAADDDGPAGDHRHLGGLHHLDLLNHPQVYEAMRSWLAAPAPTPA